MVQHQCFIFVHFYDDGINPRTIIVLIKIRFPLNLFRGPLDITDIVLGDTKSPVPLSRKLCFPHIITLYIVLLLYIFSLLQNSLTPSFLCAVQEQDLFGCSGSAKDPFHTGTLFTGKYSPV